MPIENGGDWRKPKRCDVGDCVEVRVAGTIVQMRDSKNVTGPALGFDPGVWKDFIASINADVFVGNA